MVILGPRPHVSGYFWIRTFFFADTATVRTHSVNSTAYPDILNLLNRVQRNKSAHQSGKKNKSATNPITCGWENKAILESDYGAKLCLSSYRTMNQYDGTACRPRGNKANFPPPSRALWRALKTFCQGALGTSESADTIGCVWTGEFDLNTLRVDGKIFESGKKKLRI